jgi:hypothetical protein
VGRVDEFVAALLVAGTAVVLHELAHDGTLRVPHRQTTAQHLGEAQQIELGGQLSMVALPASSKRWRCSSRSALVAHAVP